MQKKTENDTNNIHDKKNCHLELQWKNYNMQNRKDYICLFFPLCKYSKKKKISGKEEIKYTKKNGKKGKNWKNTIKVKGKRREKKENIHWNRKRKRREKKRKIH